MRWQGRVLDGDARRVSALVADDEEEAVALWRAAGYDRDARMLRFVRNL